MTANPSTKAAAEARRAEVAPLWKAGMSIRQIVAQTGIPRSAAHRAVVQLERARAAFAPSANKKLAARNSEAHEASAPPAPPASPPSSELQLPASSVMRWTIDGVPHEIRRLVLVVREAAVDAAIRQGLITYDDRDKPWVVNTALFANLFSGTTIDWLRRHGWQGNRSAAESIIAAVNEAFARLPR